MARAPRSPDEVERLGLSPDFGRILWRLALIAPPRDRERLLAILRGAARQEDRRAA
jgi:hypothetical protein